MNEALKSLRGKKLKTQQDIADLLKVSRQTYSNYETDLGSVTLNKIFEILKSLEATPEEINQFFYDLQQDKLSQ